MHETFTDVRLLEPPDCASIGGKLSHDLVLLLISQLQYALRWYRRLNLLMISLLLLRDLHALWVPYRSLARIVQFNDWLLIIILMQQCCLRLLYDVYSDSWNFYLFFCRCELFINHFVQLFIQLFVQLFILQLILNFFYNFFLNFLLNFHMFFLDLC